ncbi:MAG TPA: PEP-CTERM sorting domain-containing protein [Stellaceae bacterium]|nr:PEP-CTERM sorting domain-containing protein [Stellaceae bacterium]
MRAKHLIAATALVGATLAGLGQAHAILGGYTFDDPTGDLGPTQDYSSDPPGGGDITATGEDVTDNGLSLFVATGKAAQIIHPDLFGINTEGNQGLGLVTTSHTNEIVPGTFVQLDLINLTIPPLTSSRLGFRASGVQPGDVWEVFGTNIADTLDGATLIDSGTTASLVPDLGTDIIGVFRYLDITAAAGGILLAQLDIQFTPAPEPTSLALLGAALLGFGMLRRRHRIASDYESERL